MRRTYLAAFAGCFWLVGLFTKVDSVAAQRMRAPALVPLGPAAPPGVPRLTGTPPRAFHHGRGFHHRFVSPFGFFGWYPYGFYDYGYQDESMYGDDSTYSVDSTRDYSSEAPTRPASMQDVYVLQDTLPDLGKLVVAFEPAGSKTVVRLTWPDDHHVGATQVAFFLTDSARSVLSAQTVRTPPFTAVFDPPPATAFTGMTVVLQGGKLVTQYLPFKPRTASAR
jgi:hypothetical protein